jgi:hypothetical protein
MLGLKNSWRLVIVAQLAGLFTLACRTHELQMCFVNLHPPTPRPSLQIAP